MLGDIVANGHLRVACDHCCCAKTAAEDATIHGTMFNIDFRIVVTVIRISCKIAATIDVVECHRNITQIIYDIHRYGALGSAI